MTPLDLWASQWGVSRPALDALRNLLAPVNTIPALNTTESEVGLMTRIRLEASEKGLLLWRNNLGAAMDAHGHYIRYGLANDSKQMSENIKSSDLIGIRPGGQFIAREVKAPGWKFKGTHRELAQLRFLELVNSMGGDAQFATNEGTL